MKKLLRVLTVLVVMLLLAGGVAYVFREPLVLAVFAYMLEPSAPFDAARVPAAPDYADPESWAALPEKDDAADWMPPGYTEDPYPRRDEIDVFYIHPTGFFGTESWNAAMGERSETGIPTEAMLAGQASAFSGVGRVYAPAYRQATLYSFVEAGRENGKTNGKQALELAYSDVAAAFAYFLEHYNRGRPFILASHSQGSGHALRLIAEQIDQSDVRERMIAAYIVGCGMPADFFTRVFKKVQAGTSPTQTGCILSWDTVREGTPRSDDGFHYYDPEGWELAAGKERFCVNPLTWTQDPARAPARENGGALLMTIGTSGEDVGPEAVRGVLPEATWAELHEDIVWVRDLSDYGFGSMISNITGSYHVYDYGLFWVNIRENARVRAEAWFAGGGKDSVGA